MIFWLLVVLLGWWSLCACCSLGCPCFGRGCRDWELRLLCTEVFQHGCGGASRDLGERHKFRDGGESAVPGGVAGRGGLGADPCGCGVAD